VNQKSGERPSSPARRIAAFFLGICLSVPTQTDAAGISRTVLIEPIFHLAIPLDKTEAGFESAPSWLLRSCGVTVRQDYRYRYWIVASTQEITGRYIMLTGVTAPRSVHDSWSADNEGTFLLVGHSGCTPIDPASEVFANTLIYEHDGHLPIPDVVFRDLARDAALRYSHAYGSRDAFVRALQDQHRYPAGPDLAILRAALNR
jgi:hypothetical protein